MAECFPVTGISLWLCLASESQERGGKLAAAYTTRNKDNLIIHSMYMVYTGVKIGSQASP